MTDESESPPEIDVSALEKEELTDDALAGKIRIWQRKRGHRYSLDDVLTAWLALTESPVPERYLDLGCGIGSVLLSVADHFPSATCVGIEAQAISHALCARNIARNGLADRIELRHGDFRDDANFPNDAPFDLITGTPPYKPPGTATPSPDSQKAYARVEYRGGVEAYLARANRCLSKAGTVFVVVETAANPRVIDAAATNSLYPAIRLDAIPRASQPPLFSVWKLVRDQNPLETRTFCARNANGERTDAYFALRSFFGLPREY